MTGVWQLVRLILRRDRVIMPLWVLFIALVPVSYIATIDGVFPTAADKAQYAATSAANAGFVALYGRLFGSSLGELVAWRAGFVPVVVGLVTVLTVIRHTRTEEEAGRRELVGSTVVGRHAALAAALITTCAASLVMGLVLAAAMAGQGLPGAGSLAFGLELAATGWVFAGIAAVAAQLTAGAGSARGIGITVLGVAYVLRVVGDVSGMTDGPLTWVTGLSPIGWVQAIRPFGVDRTWLALVVLAAAAVFVAVAVLLSGRRDVGAGLLPTRPGPAVGTLGSPLALAWRLHRGLLAAWTGGFVALGVVMGYLAEGVGDLVGDNRAMADAFRRLGGASGLIDSYLAGTAGLFGLIAGAYGIQAMLRARAEEADGRVEPVLGTATGRLRWLAGHLVFSLLGPAVVLVAAGLAMGITHGLDVHDVGGELPRLLAGTVVQLPAVWILSAVAVLLFGLLPRATAAAWAALVVCLLVTLVGGAAGLDQWVLDISPFTHLPKLPGGHVTALPLVLLSVIAAIVTVAGLTGFRRRDVPA
ncbi:ABC transporter permease [Actinophytocola oryzae]|uniref:ABC-2 type transport system permease protein n=1 Tax=Actinophytocola oryzae TaxID=502181 RepID=A0A4R7VZ88_9PSEU|nr:ABC transporter permease [Actinophytocola oryzae]TDV55095.1 ABC-2 type transport system permease protein [Actinophytocola oryzae]